MRKSKSLKLEESPQIMGYVVCFNNGAGTWFYTPEKPSEEALEKVTSEEIEWKSKNFQTKDEAISFGRGFEKGKRFGTGKPFGNWNLINSKHDHHWHRHNSDSDEWKSIWADQYPSGTWFIEVYPVNEEDSSTPVQRTSHESKEEAATKVAKTMVKYE